jgi:hypothetical protein
MKLVLSILLGLMIGNLVGVHWAAYPLTNYPFGIMPLSAAITMGLVTAVIVGLVFYWYVTTNSPKVQSIITKGVVYGTLVGVIALLAAGVTMNWLLAVKVGFSVFLGGLIWTILAVVNNSVDVLSDGENMETITPNLRPDA